MTKDSFNELLKRIRKGDMSGLESIYCEYFVKMKVKATMILRSEEEGEDAALEALLRVVEYARAEQLKEVKDPGAFMYTLIKHTALNINKHKRFTINIDYIDRKEDPTDSFIDAFDQRELKAAFGALDEPERTIAYMYYAYGCKIKFISNELNMPVGTVKWRLKRIRNKFSKFFT